MDDIGPHQVPMIEMNGVPAYISPQIISPFKSSHTIAASHIDSDILSQLIADSSVNTETISPVDKDEQIVAGDIGSCDSSVLFSNDVTSPTYEPIAADPKLQQSGITEPVLLSISGETGNGIRCDGGSIGRGDSKVLLVVIKTSTLYLCFHCNFSTRSKSQLEKHIVSVHVNDNHYQCPQCEYCANRPGNLTRHIASVHKRLKPHACPHCSYSANQSRDLNKHMISVHSTEKPHVCPTCQAGFSLSGALRRHILSVHIKVKPHHCPHPQCTYSSSRRNQLERHLVNVHKHHSLS